MTKSTLFVAAATVFSLGLTTVALMPEADAGVRIRLGGRVHARGSVSVNWARPVYRPWSRPVVGGNIWWGSGYYVPSYYPGGYTYPVQSASVPAYYPVAPAQAVYAAAPLPPLPRFAIGVFGGGVATEAGEGDDAGLLGRLRLSRGLLLEGEMGRASMNDGARVDKRMSIGVAWELSPRRDWSPYLVGAVGVQKAEVSSYQTDQQFGEVGAGLRWQVGRSLQLLGDIRWGGRGSDPNAARPMDVALRQIAPTTTEQENYSRIRIAAAVTF